MYNCGVGFWRPVARRDAISPKEKSRRRQPWPWLSVIS